MHQITYSLLVVALALAASVGMLQEVGGGGCHERIYAQEIAAFCSSDDDPTPVCCHILGQVMTTEIGLTCAKSVARRPELRNIGLTFASLRDKYKKCISDDVSEDGYSMESDANSAASTVSLPRPVSITCVEIPSHSPSCSHRQ